MVENLKAKENLNKKDEKSELIDLQKKTEWLCVNHLSLAIDESYKWIVKEYSYATIKSVQYLLNKLWYDCGKVDGILVTKWKNTSKTMEAVKRFQENNWLAVDGLPGPNTIKKLLEVYQVKHYIKHKEENNKWTIEKKTIIEQEKYNRLTNKMGSLTNDERRRMVDFANSNPDKDGFISLDTDLTEIKEWQEEILSKVAGKIIFYRLEKLDNPDVVRAFVNWNVTDLWLKSLTSITDEVAIELAKIKSLHINKDILTLEQKEILKDKL